MYWTTKYRQQYIVNNPVASLTTTDRQATLNKTKFVFTDGITTLDSNDEPWYLFSNLPVGKDILNRYARRI